MQFYCRYSEFLEIRNLFDQAGKGAASFLRDAGIRVAGKSAHMHFVYDRSETRAVLSGVSPSQS